MKTITIRELHHVADGFGMPLPAKCMSPTGGSWLRRSCPRLNRR